MDIKPFNLCTDEFNPYIDELVVLGIGEKGTDKISEYEFGTIMGFKQSASSPLAPSELKLKNTEGQLRTFDILTIKKIAILEEL